MAQVYLLLVCSMIVVTSSLYADSTVPGIGRKKVSRNLYTFLALVSGYYDNGPQLERLAGSFDKHDFVQSVIKPVFVRSLRDKLVILNQDINGTITSSNLWILEEDAKGVIRAQFVNITSLGHHRPTDKNDVDYSDVTLGPLPTPGSCTSLVDRVEDNVYVGGLNICLDGTDLEVATYSMTLTSHFVVFKQGPALQPVRKVTLPFIYIKRFSFPLLATMENQEETKNKPY